MTRPGTRYIGARMLTPGNTRERISTRVHRRMLVPSRTEIRAFEHHPHSSKTASAGSRDAFEGADDIRSNVS